MQRRLAERLGVRPDEVAVVDPALAEPIVPASMPKRAAEAAAFTVAPYVLTLDLRNSALPIDLDRGRRARPRGCGAAAQPPR